VKAARPTRKSRGTRAVGPASDRRGRRWKSEKGAVLVSALMVVMLVTLLGVVAVTEAEGGSNTAAVVRKHVEVLAAANAGASAAVASVESQASTVTAQNQDLNCASLAASQDLLKTAPNGAANAASGEAYTLYYDVFTSQPTTTELDDIQASPSASLSAFSNYSAGGICSTSGSSTPIVPPSSSGSTWFLVLASSGATASNAYGASAGTGKTSVVDLQLNWSAASTTTISTTTTTPASSSTTTTVPSTTTTTGVTTGQLTSFDDAMYGKSIYPGQSFCNPVTGCPGTGDTYTNGQLNCSNSNNYMGNVVANDTTDAYAVIGGDCYIEGNLYTNGAIDITSGGGGFPCPASGSGTDWDVCDNVYVTGSAGVTIAGGFSIKGSVYANGPVNLSGGADVGGNVYAEGAVSVTGGAKIAGTTYQHCTTSCPGVPVVPQPTQSLPPLTFSSTAWQNAGFTVLNFGSNQSCDSSNGAMPSTDYAQMEADVQSEPIVVVTNCAFVWDTSENPDEWGRLSLGHSLAIFASGGFNFDNAVSTEIAGSGTPAPDLWAVVPWGGSPTPPVNGETACPGNLSNGSKPNGDVWDSTRITGANVLLYTPNNICTSSTMTMTGQIYAGNAVTAGGTFTPNPGVALPYGVTSGGGPTTTTIASTTTTTGPTTSTTRATTTTIQPTTTTAPGGNWDVTIVGLQ
jgi:hypothetical protein